MEAQQPQKKKHKASPDDVDDQEEEEERALLPTSENQGGERLMVLEWIKAEEDRSAEDAKWMKEIQGEEDKKGGIEWSNDRRYWILPGEEKKENESETKNESEILHSRFSREKLREAIGICLDKIQEDYPPGSSRDYGVYTGTSGIALLFLHASQSTYQSDENHRHKYLQIADRYASMSLQKCREQRGKYDIDYTFLCGDAGVFCISAVIAHKLGNKKKCTKMINKVLGLKQHVAKNPSELLYGQAGYLYALLYLQEYLPAEALPAAVKETALEMVAALLDTGRANSKRSESRSPLMYDWHRTRYLGGAHGLAGILFMLSHFMEILSEEQQGWILDSADYVLGKKLPSGNYPSNADDDDGELVQWCHGAPGMVSLFARLYRLTNKEKYLEATLDAADTTWRMGLLAKSLSICHGVVGNAYFLLTAYRLTKHPELLRRAEIFVEFSLSSRHVAFTRTPDCPYSLMEGLAGVCYGYIDMLSPETAAFPAYELPSSIQ